MYAISQRSALIIKKVLVFPKPLVIDQFSQPFSKETIQANKYKISVNRTTSVTWTVLDTSVKIPQEHFEFFLPSLSLSLFLFF